MEKLFPQLIVMDNCHIIILLSFHISRKFLRVLKVFLKSKAIFDKEIGECQWIEIYEYSAVAEPPNLLE